MVRALAIPMGCGDATFFSRLDACGFSKCSQVQNPEGFDDFFGGCHATTLVKRVSDFTWISSDSINGILIPSSGTLAGFSWADMLFLAAFFQGHTK
eukprot:12410619-Karenia_brevis.AAC.1